MLWPPGAPSRTEGVHQEQHEMLLMQVEGQRAFIAAERRENTRRIAQLNEVCILTFACWGFFFIFGCYGIG